MRHVNKHSRTAKFTYQVLTSLATTDFVVNANYLRFSVCDGDAIADEQFDGHMQQLIDGGFVVVAGETIYRITQKGEILKRIMKLLRDE